MSAYRCGTQTQRICAAIRNAVKRTTRPRQCLTRNCLVRKARKPCENAQRPFVSGGLESKLTADCYWGRAFHSSVPAARPATHKRSQYARRSTHAQSVRSSRHAACFCGQALILKEWHSPVSLTRLRLDSLAPKDAR